MNEINEVHTEGGVETHSEGSPDVERLEQQVLGKHYEQAEVLHRFADEHPWLHPTLIVVGVLIVAGIAWYIWKVRIVKKSQ